MSEVLQVKCVSTRDWSDRRQDWLTKLRLEYVRVRASTVQA
jgi:hypothetical protein